MSIIGSFVGALVALAVRARPDTAVDDKSHPRFIAGYDAGLKDGRMEIAGFLADARRDATEWRERAMYEQGQHAANDWQQLGQAAQNVMQQQLAQAQMASAQETQMQQAGCYQGLLLRRCDCSPSRAWGLTGVIPGA